jgi:hypothetical protein
VRDPQDADVPVTIFLSGGVDSSLVQAIVKCDVSYTVHFSEFEHTINERQYVCEFAERLGFEPRIVTPTREQFLETFSDLARCIEFPVGSFSVFPLFCLSRQARRDGFVVALSGEGATSSSPATSATRSCCANGTRRRRSPRPVRARCAGATSASDSSASAAWRAGADSRCAACCTTTSRRSGASKPRWRRISACSSRRLPAAAAGDGGQAGDGQFARGARTRISTTASSSSPPSCRTGLRYRDGQGKWLLRNALRRWSAMISVSRSRRIKHGLPAPVNQWLFNAARSIARIGTTSHARRICFEADWQRRRICSADAGPVRPSEGS